MVAKAFVEWAKAGQRLRSLAAGFSRTGSAAERFDGIFAQRQPCFTSQQEAAWRFRLVAPEPEARGVLFQLQTPR